MNWKWLEKTDTLFRKLEALGWDHLHLAPCWEHGPNIYRLAGSQYLSKNLVDVPNSTSIMTGVTNNS